MSTLSSHTVDKPKTRHDPRQVRLAERLAYNGRFGIHESMEQSMVAVGYSASTAEKMSKRTVSSASFREVAEGMGLGRGAVAKVIQDAMNARTVAVHKGEAHETDAPDHKTRLAAASLLGDFTGDKKTVIEQRSINIDVPKEALLGLLGIGMQDNG